MSIRSRITVRLDEDHKVIMFRVVGEVDGADIVDTLMKTYESLSEPWQYHRLLDLRRHDGLMHVSHIDDLRCRWQALVGDRVTIPVRGAIITSNALSFARLPSVRKNFTGKQIHTFHSLDEGMDWVQNGILPEFEAEDTPLAAGF
ncbi:hypothetical protein [Asticcacaulis machinosus]|uniref:SpoIIAA-like n=1 Tax=Asticcacaulis machinosus TaxID=2984211 RepID=A0ABT5HFT3_9CAUL|nr:hypothetical protein [Asticcacaulis machinosus]MDC7675081.1 hypothetical protein [Asticcacaulis machinosus]